jgi:hypothetical protein
LLLLRTGDIPDKVVEQYERALALNADDQIALNSIIFVRNETGRVELANSHIERLKKLDRSYNPPSNRVQSEDYRALFAIVCIIIIIVFGFALGGFSAFSR